MALFDRLKPQIHLNANHSSGAIGFAHRIRASRSGGHFFAIPAKLRAIGRSERPLSHRRLIPDRFVPDDRHSYLKLFSFEGDNVYPRRGTLSVNFGFGTKFIRFFAHQGID
jgi:hypothetical protein